jgi:hypothetical protein
MAWHALQRPPALHLLHVPLVHGVPELCPSIIKHSQEVKCFPEFCESFQQIMELWRWLWEPLTLGKRAKNQILRCAEAGKSKERPSPC